LLDRELSQLPNKYRTLIVLCDLEGKSRKQVSQQVGLKLGTLASRLATARRMLATRLSKYGLTVSGGALAASLAHNTASAKVHVSLVWSTAKAATLVAAGHFVGVSIPAVGLMKGTMKMMVLAKLKTAIGTSVVAVALGIGGLVYNAELVSGGARAEEGNKPKSELEMLRKENELLKMNLRVTLEKIISQDEELKKFKGQVATNKILGDRAEVTILNDQALKANEKAKDLPVAIIDSRMADNVASSLSSLMKERQVQHVDLAVEVSAVLKKWQETKDKESREKILKQMETLISKLRASEMKEKVDTKEGGGR
jgi:hypothetical protein